MARYRLIPGEGLLEEFVGPHEYQIRFPRVVFRGPPELINIWGEPTIGSDTSIGCFVEIGDGVVIGHKCKIGAFAFLCPGVTLGDEVFVGPGVRFSNDKHPPSSRTEWLQTVVKDRAVLGAGAIILPGVTIGEGATIGAGAVVTKDVPAGETWVGNPARKLNAG